jgi:hypothetical protein
MPAELPCTAARARILPTDSLSALKEASIQPRVAVYAGADLGRPAAALRS